VIVFTRARRRVLPSLPLRFISILFFSCLDKITNVGNYSFLLFTEYNDNDKSKEDKMGTTVSMHEKNEIEDLLRKPKGDCVEDLDADRRTVLTLYLLTWRIW
jgi:hypothetical protein